VAGLSNAGLSVKRLSEVLADNKAKAQEIFADLVEVGDVVDVSDNSALGRMVGIVAPAEAALWEQLEYVYNSFTPQNAKGVALDNIVTLSGIWRNRESKTQAQVLLSGDYNTLVRPTVQINSTTTKKYFTLTQSVLLDTNACSGCSLEALSTAAGDYTFSYSFDGATFVDVTYTHSGGGTNASLLGFLAAEIDAAASTYLTPQVVDETLSVAVDDVFQTMYFTVSNNLAFTKSTKLGVVRCTEYGVVEQAANTINNIPVPYAGLDSITNPQAATVGSVEETDIQLRERWYNSKYVQATTILEAMLDALRNVQGVEDVIIYENDTDLVDGIGLEAHSFMPIVLGGVNTDIAKTILENKPIGIWSRGNVATTILDSQGLPHVIRFKRPTSVPIYINIELTDVGGIPSDVIAQVKQNILAYAKAKYFIGDDVIYSRLYTPVNAVSGHAVNSMTIGTSPSPVGVSNIAIAFDAVSEWDADYITVTVV